MFRWIFGEPKFQFYDDSFAKTRAGMLAGLRAAMESRLGNQEHVLLVTHFVDSFENLREQLASWSIDYEIVDSDANSIQLEQRLAAAAGKVQLTLAETLVVEDAKPIYCLENATLCVMVSERHPKADKDRCLEDFCQTLSIPVQLGYFLSFEDPVIRQTIDDSAVGILEMFGMGENELVTSNLISRRLKTVLNQNSKNYTSDRFARSAEDWFRLNSKNNHRSSHGS